MLARLHAAGLTQALWLSTCDRVEVIGVHERPNEAVLTAAAILAERAGVTASALEESLHTEIGGAALHHLFAVACSLDSQIVGEPHILGQVKAAHRQACAAGQAGPALEASLQAAYAVAKRVRSETPIAEGATSLVAAAIQVARDLHGDLARCSGMVLGNGDMGSMVVEGLREAGMTRLTVAAPVDRRAAAAARRLDGHYVPWADLDDGLVNADIVVTAVGSGRYILTARQMDGVLKRRRRRPVFVVDAAIPADVEPDLQRLDGAFVYDLADLEGVALQGRVGREAATQAAWSLVGEAVSAFVRDRAERQAVPAVAALRAHFEAERQRLLSEHGELDAAMATRLLVNRLLHRPSETLRALAADRGEAGLAERAAAEKLLHRLFALTVRATGDCVDETGMPAQSFGFDSERDEDERRESGREVQ